MNLRQRILQEDFDPDCLAGLSILENWACDSGAEWRTSRWKTMTDEELDALWAQFVMENGVDTVRAAQEEYYDEHETDESCQCPNCRWEKLERREFQRELNREI